MSGTRSPTGCQCSSCGHSLSHGSTTTSTGTVGTRRRRHGVKPESAADLGINAHWHWQAGAHRVDSPASSQVDGYHRLPVPVEDWHDLDSELEEKNPDHPSRSHHAHWQDTTHFRGRSTRADSESTRSLRRKSREVSIDNLNMECQSRHYTTTSVLRDSSIGLGQTVRNTGSGSQGSVNKRSSFLPNLKSLDQRDNRHLHPLSHEEMPRTFSSYKGLSSSHSAPSSQRSDNVARVRDQSTSSLNSPRDKVSGARNLSRDPVEFDLNNAEGPRKEPIWEVKAEINETNSSPSAFIARETLTKNICRQKETLRSLSSETNDHVEAIQNNHYESVSDRARTEEQVEQEEGQDASIVQSEDVDLRAAVAALKSEMMEMKKAYLAKFEEITSLKQSFNKQEELVEELFETVDLLCESVDGNQAAKDAVTLRSFLEDLQRYVVHGSFFLLRFSKTEREKCHQFRGQRKLEWSSFNKEMKEIFLKYHGTPRGIEGYSQLYQKRSPLGEALYPGDGKTPSRKASPLPRQQVQTHLYYTGDRLEFDVYKLGIFYFFIPLFLAHYVAYRNHIELLEEMIHAFRDKLPDAVEKERRGLGGSHNYQTAAQQARIDLTSNVDIYPDGYTRWPSVGAIGLDSLLKLVKDDITARRENSKTVDDELQNAIAIFEGSGLLTSSDLANDLEPTVLPFRHRRMVAYERHRTRLNQSIASANPRNVEQGPDTHSSSHAGERRKLDSLDSPNDEDEPQKKRTRNSDNQVIPTEPQTTKFFSRALEKAEKTQSVLIHGYTTVKRWLAIVTNDEIFKHVVTGKSVMGEALNAIAHERERSVEKIYESATRLSSLFASDAEGSNGRPLSETEKAKYTDAFQEVVASVYEVSGDLLGPDLPLPSNNGRLKVAEFISRARARTGEEQLKSIFGCAEFAHLDLA